ncbi:MAG: hypothetical protein ACE5GF_07955, partial [Thermodesulfobacteriota bacterium]
MAPHPSLHTVPFNRALESVSSLRRGERLLLTTHLSSVKAFFAGALLQKTGRPLLVIAPTREGGERFITNARFFLGKDKVFFFPSWELLPFEEQSPHTEIAASRMEVLYSLSNGAPTLVVTTPRALMQRVLPAEAFIDAIETIEASKNVAIAPFIEKMENRGYSPMALVEERGEMSVRGGIVDLFPPLYPYPVRVELFGDTIESLRFFDPTTQRSGDAVDRITILPAREVITGNEARARALTALKVRGDELGIARERREIIAERMRSGLSFAGMEFFLPLFYERLDTLFDYLPKETLLLVDCEEEIHGEAHYFQREIDEMADKAIAGNRLIVRPERLYITPGLIEEQIAERGGLFFNDKAPPPDGRSIATSTAAELTAESNLDIRQDISLRREEILRPLVDRIATWLEKGWQAILAVSTEGQAERLKELLNAYRVHIEVETTVTLPLIGTIGRRGGEGASIEAAPSNHLPQ